MKKNKVLYAACSTLFLIKCILQDVTYSVKKNKAHILLIVYMSHRLCMIRHTYFEDAAGESIGTGKGVRTRIYVYVCKIR